jgi:hypothetical protein
MRYLVDEQPWTQVELDELIAGLADAPGLGGGCQWCRAGPGRVPGVCQPGEGSLRFRANVVFEDQPGDCTDHQRGTNRNHPPLVEGKGVTEHARSQCHP